MPHCISDQTSYSLQQRETFHGMLPPSCLVLEACSLVHCIDNSALLFAWVSSMTTASWSSAEVETGAGLYVDPYGDECGEWLDLREEWKGWTRTSVETHRHDSTPLTFYSAQASGNTWCGRPLDLRGIEIVAPFPNQHRIAAHVVSDADIQRNVRRRRPLSKWWIGYRNLRSFPIPKRSSLNVYPFGLEAWFRGSPSGIGKI